MELDVDPSMTIPDFITLIYAKIYEALLPVFPDLLRSAFDALDVLSVLREYGG